METKYMMTIYKKKSVQYYDSLAINMVCALCK